MRDLPEGPDPQRLSDLPRELLRGAAVALRADFNVPLTEDGRVADGVRIERTLPTIRRLVEGGARVLAMSHLGRPGGTPDPALSLKPVAGALGELLGSPVAFVQTPAGPAVGEAIRRAAPGSVILLENTRFLAGEATDDEELAALWAASVDHYVLDAFGTAHRAHVSTHALPRAVRARSGVAVAGLLVEEELGALNGAVRDPARPFVAVLGGAKISGKIEVIGALTARAERLFVGGAMANTFYRAIGLETGRSLVDPESVAVARELLGEAGPRLVLPVDCVVAPSVESPAGARVVERSGVGPDDRVADIGPTSARVIAEGVGSAGTVVWNGPMGVFETAAFRSGTIAVAHAAAAAAERSASVVVGGGDSAWAVRMAGLSERFAKAPSGHISTAGGATLDWLAGRELPAIAALSPRTLPLAGRDME